MTSKSNTSSSNPRIITPQHIDLYYNGDMHITFHASVVDSEYLAFTVPRKQIRRVVDSMQVTDSRGSKPKIILPAPNFSSFKNVSIDPQNAWNDILEQHQGSLVQIRTGDEHVQGHLMGIKWETPRDDPKAHILLLDDSKVSTHLLDTVKAITFKDKLTSDQLSRFASSKLHELETLEHCCILIFAHGIGPSQVTISYLQRSVSSPPFDISYLAYADENAPKFGSHPNMLVKWVATVQNPLHYDLNDVKLSLYSNNYRENLTQLMYADSFYENDSIDLDAASTTSYFFEKSSIDEPAFSKREQISDSDSLDLQMGEEGNFLDNRSIDASTCSIVADNRKERTTLCESRRISIRERECLRIPLFEKHYEGGLVYYLYVKRKPEKKGNCVLAMHINNINDEDLHPGRGTFWNGKESVQFVVNGQKSGRGYFCILSNSTGCRASLTHCMDLEEVLERGIDDKKLTVSIAARSILKCDIHNLEDRDIDLFIQYDSADSSRMECESNAKLYQGDQKISEYKTQNEPVSIEQCFRNKAPGSRQYKLPLKSKMKYRFVISERVTRNLEIDIFNRCSMKTITKLESKMIIDCGLAMQLKDLLKMKREMKRLHRERMLHRRRLGTLRNYQLKKADEDWVDVEKPVASENTCPDRVEDRYLVVISKSTEAMRKIEETLDEIEVKQVKLRSELRKKIMHISN